jgi:hypothetical protein
MQPMKFSHFYGPKSGFADEYFIFLYRAKAPNRSENY